MELVAGLYVFVVGLCFGSFYNVVGLRMPENKSIIRPRSSCPHCHHQLKAIELIPVVSYILQRGKCKKCGTKISFVYPLMELITGLLFVLALSEATSIGFLVVSLTFISMLVIITVSDIAYQLILDKHLIFFMVVFIIERIMFKNIQLTNFLDFVLMYVVVWLFAVIMTKILKKEALGGGDIKLLAVNAFMLGFVNTLVSIFIAAVIALVAILLSKKRDYIAFGPFLAIGAIIMWFYGSEIINWYVGLLF